MHYWTCLYQREKELEQQMHSQSQSKAAGCHRKAMGWMQQVPHQKVMDLMQKLHQMEMVREQSGQTPMIEVVRRLQMETDWKQEQVAQSRMIAIAALSLQTELDCLQQLQNPMIAVVAAAQ